MTETENILAKPEEIPKDCYLCAKAPKIDIGKPYCMYHCEHIEPTHTGKGPVMGWSCADVAKGCDRFKPKKLYYDEEANLFYEVKGGQKMYYTQGK